MIKFFETEIEGVKYFGFMNTENNTIVYFYKSGKERGKQIDFFKSVREFKDFLKEAMQFIHDEIMGQKTINRDLFFYLSLIPEHWKEDFLKDFGDQVVKLYKYDKHVFEFRNKEFIVMVRPPKDYLYRFCVAADTEYTISVLDPDQIFANDDSKKQLYERPKGKPFEGMRQ